MDKPDSPQDVLKFWFEECTPKQWFEKDEGFDRELKERFGPLVEEALAGNLDNWSENCDGGRALIILLDQFTRNIYRDTPQAFAGDESALALTELCVNNNWLEETDPDGRAFILMPMMHSEELAIQEASLPLFKAHTPENNYDYAIRHRDVVARFGRFPHRNAILGRKSTPEEEAFLKQKGSSF